MKRSELRAFIGPAQLGAINGFCRGEEGDHFRALLAEFAARIAAMPKTYEQDGLGMEAVAHLHYFTGGGDWYITEKDSDPDGAGQVQAFGSANLGYGAELGYISIEELLDAGAELDLYFTPRPLSSITKAAA